MANKTATIVDAGPLVALFNQRDRAHKVCVDRFKRLSPPLLTCEAAITEAMHLLRNVRGGQERLIALFERDILKMPLVAEREIVAIGSLMKKYADQPMDFADACLVRMSEIFVDCKVWTLDSDFETYRRLGRKRVPLLKR